MDFLKLVRSLEEFLYEVMTWLIFYPRTMWRAVRHPLQTLEYTNKELGEAPDKQFTDLLSPPLFLMITILLSHLVEIASHQNMPKPTTDIAKQIAASEQNLLILRSILFSIYPLMFAMARLRRQKKELTRETLRPPFCAQCYIAAPAAFVFGIATILGRAHQTDVQIAGALLSLATVAWYISVETIWLHKHTRISRLAAARSTFRTWFLASMLNAIISLIILGPEG